MTSRRATKTWIPTAARLLAAADFQQKEEKGEKVESEKLKTKSEKLKVKVTNIAVNGWIERIGKIKPRCGDERIR
jgi:hypothetical protein